MPPTARGSWTLVLAALTSVAVGCGGGDRAGDDATRRPAGGGAAGQATHDSARLLARQLMDWQGGQEAWERTRYLQFRWIVESGGEVRADRSHAWDRWEGRYRLTYQRDDGRRFYALFDVQSLKSDTIPDRGDVWVGGDRLTGAARDSALRQAYRAFINDSYWLLMPLKWFDPGVHLAYEGWTELPDGERYPTVHLRFESELGVTDDEYWGFLDPASGKMVAWRYHLQGREAKGDVIWWRDWRDVGPVKLALDRRWTGGDTRIHFQDVVADTVVPAGVFTPPVE